MIMGIALRFMPQFATEMKQTADAQASRGARVTGGPLGGVRMLGSVAIPLFTGVFRHAETLSAAMDARCYHGEQGRTRLHALTFGRGDALAAVVTVLLMAAVAYLLVRRIVRHPLGVIAGVMILAGGVGNLIDRLFRGYVVDMFDLTLFSYPMFNFADCCVVVGAILGAVYYLFFYDKYDKRERPHGNDTPDGDK